ncbi:acetyltransferase [Ralstonia flaminis]|jgi:putative acetyltransferase|uniref:Peptidyl-lysine N-acetyltransferase YjaB n=1 Tax=Ralstonia flaminis TaxID=3058597 RepID=A0ABM9KAE9_9RALS|nr:acetyltransferase [Ralstonia sp. LMG 18101]CAJ0821860.1 Peptidyl-lysine N-acetyltransferase YjaB [Ralstonia sp. LMG 18101]
MIQLRTSTQSDAERVLAIWRNAVDATHHFLRPEDRLAIESEVVAFLPSAPLELAVNETGEAIGFMLINAQHMEALFIDANHRGTGVGRYLVEEALRRHPKLTVDVNEQNTQAVGFYERMGFEHCGRSALDSQGRPYPLIHLRYRLAA